MSTSKMIRLLPTFAIAWITYVNRGSAEDKSGKKDLTWLESAVLRKDAGNWRIHFFHSTRAP
jgi:hypothetical protein